MMLKDTDTSTATDSEGVGYGRPPKDHQFKKGGPSANPKGRPRKAKASLVESMAAQLDHEVPLPDARRRKISRLQLMVRNLVRQAITGDMQAVAEVVRISKLGENDPTPNKPYWMVYSYEYALACHTPEEMTEEFFRKQERDIAEWTRELRTKGRSLPAMLEIELSRKIEGERGGVTVKTTVREAFIAAALRAAAQKPSLMRKVLSMLPEKKLRYDDDRVQVLRPTERELERYPAPGQTHDEWRKSKAAKV